MCHCESFICVQLYVLSLQPCGRSGHQLAGVQSHLGLIMKSAARCICQSIGTWGGVATWGTEWGEEPQLARECLEWLARVSENSAAWWSGTNLGRLLFCYLSRVSDLAGGLWEKMDSSILLSFCFFNPHPMTFLRESQRQIERDERKALIGSLPYGPRLGVLCSWTGDRTHNPSVYGDDAQPTELHQPGLDFSI